MSRRFPTIASVLAMAAVSLAATSLIAQQSSELLPVDLGPARAVIEPEVTFLEKPPTIDGILDDDLRSLPAREFVRAYRSAADTLVPVTYRLAYGTGFFYLYLEARAPRFAFRDRAYQNGDGFALLIAKPRPDGRPTAEYYMLACSAVDDPAKEWSRHVFWSYNVDKIFLPTSEETKMEFHEGGGTIGFELLLPWKDVRPYHPWILEGIGFDLMFTKAVGDTRAMYYTVDTEAPEEGKPPYVVLKFQAPELKNGFQTFVSLVEGHVNEGDSLEAVAVTASSGPARERVAFGLAGGEGGTGFWGTVREYAVLPGITRERLRLGAPPALSGGYQLKWRSKNRACWGTWGLSVLPRFSADSLDAAIERSAGSIAPASYATLKFLLRESRATIDSLKPYETCFAERDALERFLALHERVLGGRDPLPTATGFVRKAYRSKLDGTFQPYDVYVPEGFDHRRTYPLMVFLHGSESSETSIEKSAILIPKGFFALGPLGRGKSNAFSREHAQEDIAEAIEAVKAEYPIDGSRVLLAGFSMGGYGVYRTYDETPKTFRALAVFSGGPDLGKQYASPDEAPDYSVPARLKRFRGVPVFVFHGEEDLNVRYATTVDLVSELKRAGARVEFVHEPDTGHELPGPDSLRKYLQWVDRAMK